MCVGSKALFFSITFDNPPVRILYFNDLRYLEKFTIENIIHFVYDGSVMFDKGKTISIFFFKLYFQKNSYKNPQSSDL